MKPSNQKITKTTGKIPAVRLESQMLNETFNKVPVEQEQQEDDDTIAYTSANNRKPLLPIRIRFK